MVLQNMFSAAIVPMGIFYPRIMTAKLSEPIVITTRPSVL